MKFLIATCNQGKFQEFKSILLPIGIEVVSFKECGKKFNMPLETGLTFKENAEIKARYAYKLTNIPCIADDSGLEVDALAGEPGIYSARYAGENATDLDRINKLLLNMENIPDDKRSARFVCSICCILSNNEIIFSEETCEGSILRKVSGQGGFGYDPIFMTSDGKAFANFSLEQKNKISHRGKALNKLCLMLKNKIK